MKIVLKISLLVSVVLSTLVHAKIDTIHVDKNTKYSAEMVPEKMSVHEKKQRFRDLFVPAINEVYSELDKLYKETKVLVNKDAKNPKVIKLMKSYGAKNPQDLLRRIKPHPKSIALSQAAMESSWATSRFFRVGKNAFGVRSLDINEPKVAAGEKKGNKTIWVKKYSSVNDSIRDYYKLLATSRAFEDFRTLKMKTSNPHELVKKLDKYSEIGAEYAKELTAIINYNRFNEFD